MYKFYVYRHKKGTEPTNADQLISTPTCTDFVIARAVEHLNEQNPDYNYYFTRGEYMSTLDYCMEEIKKAWDELPEVAERSCALYIIDWLGNGTIIDDEADALREYNALLARNYAKGGKA